MATPHSTLRHRAEGEDTFLRSAWPAIRRSARRSNPSASDDLAQDVAFKLLLAYRRQAQRPSQPKNVALIISNATRNAHRARVRRAAVEALADESELDVASEAANDDRESASVYRRIDEVLQGRLRDVFECLYALGLSQREAAARLRLSQPRIAQLHRELLSRARATLGLVVIN